MKNEALQKIFALQQGLNEKCGVPLEEIQSDPVMQIKWLLNYSRALGQENAELVDSVPWKWWAKYQELDIQNAKVEIIDMLHFLVSLAQVTGMTADDLVEGYLAKHKVNVERQEGGYTEKDHDDSKHILADEGG